MMVVKQAGSLAGALAAGSVLRPRRDFWKLERFELDQRTILKDENTMIEWPLFRDEPLL
jgi:hypothetical protein